MKAFAGFLLVVFICLYLLVGRSLIFTGQWGWFVVWFLVLGYFVAGLRVIKHEERAIVELFGSYFATFGPGPKLTLPWIMRIRAIVSIWEQTLILFKDGVKIDLKDGSVQPQGAKVLVKILNPDEPYSIRDGDIERDGVYRAIYNIDDWERRIIDTIENAVRTYLNRLTIDEAISQAKAGYDLTNQERDEEGLPNREIERIREDLKRWGFELFVVTIRDFELEPDIIKARGMVQIRQREAEAARSVAQIRSEEIIGAFISMLARSRGIDEEIVMQEINGNAKKRREFLETAKDLLSRRMAIDGKSLVDVRVDGAEGIEKSILNILAAWKGMPGSGGQKGSEGDSDSGDKKSSGKRRTSAEARASAQKTRQMIEDSQKEE